MRLLTIILVLFSLSVQAQFTGIGNKKFRRLTDFSMPTRNFGADTVKAISIIDTSRSSGLILISKDSTAMYPYADTMRMYTTAKAWEFTPSLPCCVPDTIDLNFITTQCTTVTSNRWRPVLTDSLGRASTTACDTISYLYVDTINYGVDLSGLYIPLAGTETGSPVTGNIYFNFGGGETYIGKTSSTDQTGFITGTSVVESSGFYQFGNDTTLSSSIAYFSNYVDTDSAFVILTPSYARGIKARDYYGANYDSLTYVQKKYVDDNFTPNSSILTDTATLNFASIPAQLFEDLTVTVTGASVGDVVSIGIPTAAAVPSAMFTAFVSASNTVTIRAANISLIAIDPASGLFKVKVFKD
jgi:hypothetical protein